MLDLRTFESVVKNAPLVAIEFVIRRKDSVFLGLRKNAPAKGFWFNLGGRIRKNETHTTAIKRVFRDETGDDVEKYSHEFLGVFDHIYEENYFEREGYGTHYVVLAYQVAVDEEFGGHLSEQHSDYRWWSMEALLGSEAVHGYTKAYFNMGV